MTSATESPVADGLVLSAVEQAVLDAETLPFAATLRDPVLQGRYAELHAAVQTGVIPTGLIGLVEALAELLLQTQRIRRQHGPEAERALAALYYRTPRGALLKQSVAEVNDALASLSGQTLAEMAFTPTPGGQRLSITTERGQVEILIDRAGVRIERVELGSVI